MQCDADRDEGTWQDSHSGVYHNLTGIFDDDFTCPKDDPVCNACYDPVTKKFSRQTQWSKSVTFMSFGDVIAYMMVVAMVATSIAEELRDIALCVLATRGKGERKWRLWCWLLQTYRRFCFVGLQ